MAQTIHKIPAYSTLADIYDEIMADVDYETWADYIDEILMQHHPNATDIHELACGTGTMALSLSELGYYSISASDGSEDMIRVARKKAEQTGADISFNVINFLNIPRHHRFDAVFMVFDSINYLHQPGDILRLHQQVYQVLKPGGLFIYDFTTPLNSRQAIRVLNNLSRRVGPETRFHRESIYDAKNRIHTNRFLIEQTNPEQPEEKIFSEEEHQQKIYTQKEMAELVKSTEFRILEAYDGFELKPAHDKSLRITMVLQK